MGTSRDSKMCSLLPELYGDWAFMHEEFIFYKSTSETFHIIEGIFTHMKSKLRASMQVGSMAAIKEMAQFGMGIGLLPRWIALDEISEPI